MPDLPTAGDSEQGWDDLLTELETDLAEIRSSAAPMTGRWAAPSTVGPIPAHLERRALDLIAAQQDVLGMLRREQLDIARHLAALHAVPSVSAAPSPVYLDVQG